MAASQLARTTKSLRKTKLIGEGYSEEEAERLARQHVIDRKIEGYEAYLPKEVTSGDYYFEDEETEDGEDVDTIYEGKDDSFEDVHNYIVKLSKLPDSFKYMKNVDVVLKLAIAKSKERELENNEEDIKELEDVLLED